MPSRERAAPALRLMCAQGKEMNAMVRAYVTYIMEKTQPATEAAEK